MALMTDGQALFLWYVFMDYENNA